MNVRFLVAFALALTLPSAAWAHPGHGATEATSVLHYMAEPLHAVALLAALGAGAIAIALRRTRQDRR